MWNKQSNHFNRSIITQPRLLLIVMTGSVSAQRTAVEALMLRYLTSILSPYPGDVIVTGTPDGVGAARKPPEFLKPGDEVTIEIEGIGALKTPMRATTRANQ